ALPIFLEFFQISPHYDLNIMQLGQSLNDITCRALRGLDEVLEREHPDMVLVQGDTTTTFVAALAAYYHRIPSGHIEAGLRTGDKFQPYPEEVNRRLVGAIADLHFAPTRRARDNLLREGVSPSRIFVTGNTVVDALLWCLARLPKPEHSSSERILLVTAHRRENWGEPLKRICRALKRILMEFANVRLIFPVHRNPIVREIVNAELSDAPRMEIIEPPSYFEFIQWMRRAYIIVTDSGGVQEEAPTLGKPVLVLREVTERPEGVEAGVVKVVGTDEERIVSEVRRLLTDEDAYSAMSHAVNPYGDGRAASRIVAGLRYFFGLANAPPPEYQTSS
ncbi:MAG TPA: UDP-N-acetylglucosamine 2-epimerase (non-hydrolyzing), partial [Armatimonadetes bacterium]|nr:UDP-N-acetylglucosamine 2-epimerase (non-hydrolyzing) [Armatimonadota bacterium]